MKLLRNIGTWAGIAGLFVLTLVSVPCLLALSLMVGAVKGLQR